VSQMRRTPRSGAWVGCAPGTADATPRPLNGGERAATGTLVLRTVSALGMLGDFSVVVIVAAGAVAGQAARRALTWPSPPMTIGGRGVQDSSISFRSRSGFARPNSCILRALILLTVPSTAPEL